MSLGKKDAVATQEAFDKMLGWLDADRERAGQKYEKIRSKLIKIFVCRGCINPEELADETIDRVMRKVSDIADGYVGDPALYFSNVAGKIYLENMRKKPVAELPPPPAPDPIDDYEPEYECLDKCMGKLTPDNRELILEYYKDEKRAKIDARKELADRLGIALNALRIRATRIRASLEECITECLKKR